MVLVLNKFVLVNEVLSNILLIRLLNRDNLVLYNNLILFMNLLGIHTLLLEFFLNNIRQDLDAPFYLQ